MFFNIRMDRELMVLCNEHKLRFDELYLIISLSLESPDLIKTYLRGRTGDQCTAYFQPLERKLLVRKLTPELTEFDLDNYELTTLGAELFDGVSSNVFIDNDVPPNTERVTMSTDVPTVIINPLEPTLVDKFLELFPEGIRNAGEEYLRGNRTDATDKMDKFIKKYKYTEETILAATKYYISKQAKNHYAYCSASHYFISKSGISKLATECEAILRGEETNTSASWDVTM